MKRDAVRYSQTGALLQRGRGLPLLLEYIILSYSLRPPNSWCPSRSLITVTFFKVRKRRRLQHAYNRQLVLTVQFQNFYPNFMENFTLQSVSLSLIAII